MSPRPGDEPLEQVWTCVAAEVDGAVDAGAIGRRTRTREATFAFRRDAEAWLAGYDGEGFTLSGPTPVAMLWHGETDSPSNCWICRVSEDITASTEPQDRALLYDVSRGAPGAHRLKVAFAGLEGAIRNG